MKRNIKSFSHQVSCIFLILIVGFIFQSQAFGQELSAAQKEIWAMEEKFWTSWQKKGGESLIAFHHEKAIIWASDASFPRDRTFTDSHYYYGIGSHIDSFDLTPHEIRNLGDVAVVQYEATVNSLGRQLKFRLSHSWMKQQGQWKIIGAMQHSCKELARGK